MLLSQISAERFAPSLVSSSLFSFWIRELTRHPPRSFRYALTLRVMITNHKRRSNFTRPSTPRLFSAPPELTNAALSHLLLPPTTGTGAGDGDGLVWSLPDAGYEWPEGMEDWSPAALPEWLQDGALMDLGLPQDGSDAIFLSHE